MGRSPIGKTTTSPPKTWCTIASSLRSNHPGCWWARRPSYPCLIQRCCTPSTSPHQESAQVLRQVVRAEAKRGHVLPWCLHAEWAHYSRKPAVIVCRHTTSTVWSATMRTHPGKPERKDSSWDSNASESDELHLGGHAQLWVIDRFGY
jgi:hypothetical protein